MNRGEALLFGEPWTPEPPSGPPTDTAQRLRKFIGACGHFEWRVGSVYGDRTAETLDMMAEAGVTWWRGGVMTEGNYAGWYPTRLQQIRDAGFSASFLNTEYAPHMNWVAANWPTNKLVGLEWPNEADLFWGKRGGDQQWAQHLAEAGASIVDGAAARPALSDALIIGPSFGAFDGVPGTPTGFSTSSQSAENAWNALGRASADAYDTNNSHCYAGENSPNDAHLTKERTRHTFGIEPMLATEWGWHTGAIDQSGVPESVQAIYTQRMFLDQFNHGWLASAPYEFADQDSNEPVGGEAHYGWVRSDLTPKPLWFTMRHQALTLGPANPPTVPAGLDFSLIGPESLRYVVVQRADNRHVIILWRQVSCWDSGANQIITPASVNVTVTAPAGAWQVHRSTEQTIQNISSDGSHDIPVGGAAVLVVV